MPLRPMTLIAATVASLAVIAIASSGTATAAEARWADVRQLGPVEVRAEYRFDRRTASAVSQLVPLRRDLQARLGVTLPDRPVEVNLFRSRTTYANYLRPRIPQGVGRAALFVQGVVRGRVYAVYSTHIDVDIRHECTHAFLHSGLPYVPLWLDEGLAEYFEIAPAYRFAGNPHLRPLRRSLWLGWKPRLDRLESLASIADMGEDEYREAWAWVHYMLHGPEPVRQVLKDYLKEIESGGYAGALAPKLAAVVDDPERALKDHLRRIPQR